MRVQPPALPNRRLYGIEDLTANHFSARVPDAPNHFLIKPTALLFSEVTRRTFAVMTKAVLVYETEHTSIPAGPRIHGSILDARPDVNATMHLHNRRCSGFCHGLRPEVYFAVSMRFAAGRLPPLWDWCTRRGGTPSDRRSRRQTRHVSENHGTLITGRSIPECFLLHHYLERACEIQVAAMSSGATLKEPPIEECLKMAQGWAENRPPPGDEHVGDRDFQAMVRKVEAIDPGFRE